ncbi:MAG: hypothetical protein ABSD56_00830 [Bryobacteraceae bacterium]
MKDLQRRGLFQTILDGIYSEKLIVACKVLLGGCVLLGVVLVWPIPAAVAIALCCAAAVSFKTGKSRGWRDALKLAYDAEMGHVTSDRAWNEEGAFGIRVLYKDSLQVRVLNGGSVCPRCGWKSGDDFGGTPIWRNCCICFARMNPEIAAKRYVLQGTGPFCKTHFEQAQRIVKGETIAFTCTERCPDEWRESSPQADTG